MASEFEQVRKDIVVFLSSLRRTIDRPYRLKRPFTDAERERHMRSLLLIEEARIRFNTYVRYDQEPTTDEWKVIQKELLSFIQAFMDTGLTDPVSYERTLLVTPMISSEREKPSPFIELIINREHRPTIAEAIVRFRRYIQETEFGINQQRNLLSLNELGRLVPAQQLAPVQFNIVENRIVISDQPPKSAEADNTNAQ